MTLALIWFITLILLGTGLLGTIIPGLPGVGLVFAGVLVYALATSFAQISVMTVVIFGMLAALALAASYAGSVVGSRLGGGKRFAVVGTLLGALIGVTAGPLGLLAGAFLGALMGALIEGKRGDQAVTVAAYSIIGVLGGTIIQFLLGVVMIIAFLVAVLA